MRSWRVFYTPSARATLAVFKGSGFSQQIPEVRIHYAFGTPRFKPDRSTSLKALIHGDRTVVNIDPFHRSKSGIIA